ncbi:hypothetical protein TNCV_897791 [Trichonephila clavipes]|nr:hypothetical protein TNCV_897791 [Trichonephila clavipes]
MDLIKFPDPDDIHSVIFDHIDLMECEDFWTSSISFGDWVVSRENGAGQTLSISLSQKKRVKSRSRRSNSIGRKADFTSAVNVIGYFRKHNSSSKMLGCKFDIVYKLWFNDECLSSCAESSNTIQIRLMVLSLRITA